MILVLLIILGCSVGLTSGVVLTADALHYLWRDYGKRA
jgi:hypothetical protein